MTRIVSYAHRPKRLPRKKAQAAASGDDDQPDPELRAWLERAKWGHGPSR